MKTLLLGEVTPLLKSLLQKEAIVTTTKPAPDVELIIVRGGILVNELLIAQLPNLKVVISAGIGVDNIDLIKCAQKNITVCNCPKASTISVAEHTLALLLAGTKNIAKSDRQLKEGVWDRQNNIGHDAAGKVVGIVGLGRIGSQVATLCKALGFKVIAYDPYVTQAKFKKFGVTRITSLKSLVNKANYLSLHTPKTPETMTMFKDIALSSLKQPNGIVNTARGGILLEQKLKAALQNKSLGFYGCDVFEDEVKPDKELIAIPTVIATPHIAANTIEAQERVAYEVIRQIVAWKSKTHSKLNIIKP